MSWIGAIDAEIFELECINQNETTFVSNYMRRQMEQYGDEEK